MCRMTPCAPIHDNDTMGGGPRHVAGRAGTALAILALAACAALLGTAAPARAASVTCTVAPPSVVYGGTVTVDGTVDPAVEGQEIVVALGGDDVATALTDASGAFAVEFAPARCGEVTARLTADGSVSPPAPLAVLPAVSVGHGRLIPFLFARVELRVAPATYDGVVTLRVSHRGRRVATLRGTVRDGRLMLRVPLRGIGWFGLRFELSPTDELGARVVKKSVKLGWRRLAVGSTGPRVRGLLTQLRRLRVRVPGVGEAYTSAVADAVMAFQKAYRLPRTYVVDYDDWRRLDCAVRIKPRYAAPERHLEIDKTRQIAMVVDRGSVIGVVHVSTGATGNTPEGSFRILRKNPMSATWDGTVALPFFMTFHGQMGLHGYPFVPPYPASHGCVREPLWVCGWTYAQSFVGERLYIYH